MKKLSVILLAQLVGTVAMAQTSLTVLTTNGSVAPQYQVKTTCTISENGIVTVLSTGGFAHGAHPARQAQFTHDVSAPAVMVQLAKESITAKESSTGARAPMGGANSSYMVTINKKSNEIRSVSNGSVVILDTQNDSAKKLADFMQVNCK